MRYIHPDIFINGLKEFKNVKTAYLCSNFPESFSDVSKYAVAVKQNPRISDPFGSEQIRYITMDSISDWEVIHNFPATHLVFTDGIKIMSTLPVTSYSCHISVTPKIRIEFPVTIGINPLLIDNGISEFSDKSMIHICSTVPEDIKSVLSLSIWSYKLADIITINKLWTGVSLKIPVIRGIATSTGIGRYIAITSGDNLLITKPIYNNMKFTAGSEFVISESDIHFPGISKLSGCSSITTECPEFQFPYVKSIITNYIIKPSGVLSRTPQSTRPMCRVV